MVVHQLAGPLDGADADQQEREAQGQAQEQVRGAQTEEHVRVVADVEDEVGDAEQDRADRRQAEHGGDLTLGALLRVRIDVSRPRLVLRQPRVRKRVGVGVGEDALVVLLDRDRRLVTWDDRLAVVGVAHDLAPFFVLRVVWEAIQIAKPTSEPIPTIQAYMPSLTGPRPPREKPPYSGVSSMLFR